MKLVVITAVSEFENEIKDVLLKSKVKTFSHCDVKGFRDSSMDSIDSNWFASEMNESESVLFYAFTLEENIINVLERIRVFNDSLETMSKIHVAIINIENSNFNIQ
jgi:hypothetical protein